jgi:hypothetical protein
MKKLFMFASNPLFWVVCLLLSLNLLVIGWNQSYPLSYAPEEKPILESVSVGFWLGLASAFIALVGLVSTSTSRYMHWLASCLFVLLLTVPQFLYLSYGSDAGVLPGMVEHRLGTEGMRVLDEIDVDVYFQWPMSIFWSTFLSDAFGVQTYTAVNIAFVIAAICISSGFFVLWSSRLESGSTMTQAVFWGIVSYFVGYYWLMNWQAAPYVFMLALFVPMLGLLEKGDLSSKLMLLLLFSVGIETHALFGIWSIAIVVIWLGIRAAKLRSYPAVALAATMVVAQLSVIVYKNIRFFQYVVSSLQGYYQALVGVDAVDKVLSRQAQGALSPLPSDPFSAVLKVISWIGFALVVLAFAVALISVIRHRRIRALEIALVVAGAVHLLIGNFYAAIGVRALNLLMIVLASFVTFSIARNGRLGNVVLAACALSLLVFPASLMRSHQASSLFVRPVQDQLARTLALSLDKEISYDIAVIGEHNTPLETAQRRHFLSARQIQYRMGSAESIAVLDWLCAADLVVMDTQQFRTRLLGIVDEQAVETLDNASVFYDNESVKLKLLKDQRLFSYCKE